jgi:hypothetical protein
MDKDDSITVEFDRGAARKFVNVLLDAAAGDKPNREWLLWGVGLIAQAGKAQPKGPDA